MFLDKIIVINLQRAVKRKENITNSLRKNNIDLNNVIFFPAFDANSLNSFFERSLYSKSMDRTFAKSELCCTLSHISAIKMAKSLQCKNVLILEDDIELCDDFLNRFELLEAQLPKSWQQIYLGAIIDNKITQISQNIYEVNKLDGTHAYILNSSVFDIVCDEMLKFSSATDGEYNIMRNNGILKSHIFYHFLHIKKMIFLIYVTVLKIWQFQLLNFLKQLYEKNKSTTKFFNDSREKSMCVNMVQFSCGTRFI